VLNNLDLRPAAGSEKVVGPRLLFTGQCLLGSVRNPVSQGALFHAVSSRSKDTHPSQNSPNKFVDVSAISYRRPFPTIAGTIGLSQRTIAGVGYLSWFQEAALSVAGTRAGVFVELDAPLSVLSVAAPRISPSLACCLSPLRDGLWVVPFEGLGPRLAHRRPKRPPLL
jgi:hypothetical protein